MNTLQLAMLVPPFYIRCSLIEWKRFLWHLQLGASTCISKDYWEKNWIKKILPSKIGRKIKAYRWCSGALRLSTSFGFFINTVEWIIKKRPMLCLDLACTNRRVRSFESLHSNRSRVSVLWWGRRKLCLSKLFSSEPWYMVWWLWNHNARILSFWTAELSSILVGWQSLVKNFAVKWEHMLLQMWNFLLKWDNLCDELLSLPPHPNRQITITTSLFPVQTLHSYGRLFHYLQKSTCSAAAIQDEDILVLFMGLTWGARSADTSWVVHGSEASPSACSRPILSIFSSCNLVCRCTTYIDPKWKNWRKLSIPYSDLENIRCIRTQCNRKQEQFNITFECF